jgi:hypothetical protein
MESFSTEAIGVPDTSLLVSGRFEASWSGIMTG